MLHSKPRPKYPNIFCHLTYYYVKMSLKQQSELVKIICQRLKEKYLFEKCLNKVKLVSAGDGKCTVEFVVEPEHQNPNGALHGGLAATLVDSISTYALMTHGRQVPGVSVDIHISYLKPAKSGEKCLVEARTIKSGKTLAFLDVIIKNKETGSLLVLGHHTKFVG